MGRGQPFMLAYMVRLIDAYDFRFLPTLSLVLLA